MFAPSRAPAGERIVLGYDSGKGEIGNVKGSAWLEWVRSGMHRQSCSAGRHDLGAKHKRICWLKHLCGLPWRRRSEYASFIKHGHAWMTVHIGGVDPTTTSANGASTPNPDYLFLTTQLHLDESNPNSPTVPIPVLPVIGGKQLQWTDVEDILSPFVTGGSADLFVLSPNNQVSPSDAGYFTEGTKASAYPQTCLQCHNPTGFNPSGHEYGIANLPGSWASDQQGNPMGGVQCEHCHGAGVSLVQKQPANGTMVIPDKQICRDCHSTNGINAAAGTQFQIPVTLSTATGVAGQVGVAALFNNHHPEGDEYRTSPHQNMGCSSIFTDLPTGQTPTFSCHDPHGSVWHNDGGVAVGNVAFNVNADPSDPTYAGNMCTTCHSAAITVTSDIAAPGSPSTIPAIRIRGPMGDIGLACIDCHMPEISASGTRKAHIFKINSTNLTAAENTYTNAANGKVCWNGDAQDPSSPNQASLTLDLVCTQCHNNMTMDELAAAAVTIHLRARNGGSYDQWRRFAPGCLELEYARGLGHGQL